MGPQISIYDASNTYLVNNWDIGTLKAQTPSEVLTVNIWNNKGGITAVSDLKEVTFMILDSTGDTANGDVAKDQWVQINVPSVDGNSNVWTPIGGTVTKDIKANGGVSDYTISGIANDGNAANSPQNVATISLRVVAPANSNPGEKSFRARLVGYFT